MKSTPYWKLLLGMMADEQWHSMRELQAVGGWRYGGRLYELKSKGWDHEVETRAGGERFYRIFPMAPPPGQMRLDLHTTQEAV